MGSSALSCGSNLIGCGLRFFLNNTADFAPEMLKTFSSHHLHAVVNDL